MLYQVFYTSDPSLEDDACEHCVHVRGERDPQLTLEWMTQQDGTRTSFWTQRGTPTEYWHVLCTWDQLQELPPGWKKFSQMSDLFHSDGTPLHTFAGLENELRTLDGGFNR